MKAFYNWLGTIMVAAVLVYLLRGVGFAMVCGFEVAMLMVFKPKKMPKNKAYDYEKEIRY